MIRIERASNIDESFFEGRDFGDSLDAVKDVLKDVKSNGDGALHCYTAKFDMADPVEFEIPLSALKAAADKMQRENPDLYKSICYSHELALRFAKKQKESFGDFETELEPGVFTGQKNIAVERAGVYVPAGRFPLVSSVVMTVTPAVAAGVKEVILCTPPRVHPDDRANAEKQGLGLPGKAYIGGKAYADENIMAAAYICGVTKAYALGGSQAIAALAFGTQSIPRVDVVVGPGNKFVAEAKKLVYGTVGIDMLAGPTEVFIIADSSASPEWVAADLLAQAEHDVVAQPILATPDEELARKVAAEIDRQLEDLPTKQTAAASIESFGRILITQDLDEAVAIANRKAPEHLELAMEEGAERDRIASLVHNYGSLFIGHNAAEVFGDYAAGLNHTLPTSGSARFTGGLSVRMFLKTVTTLRVEADKKGAVCSARAATCLGKAEGLAAHAHSAELRLNAFTGGKVV
ncbi:MAG: histidinol dehydrogenase [Treponema sp.]|nr:histidinol dehydrogenase [Treponema sp.]